ncbi:MAG TPA: MOSC domain-containing protein [Tianweitania sediminis]|jgi:MOSC domain-containing protein YiiM|nr:MOSC domain-containing protein [Tianweitania sediminis]
MAAVVAVCSSAKHGFSKTVQDVISLRAGLGVAGDAHEGVTVKHRSRVARDPSQPNLRQVHLIHAELFALLSNRGFTVAAGDLGENITTQGIDLLALPTGTRLFFGDEASVELTGLRNPCAQTDGFQPGLMKAVLDRDADGNLVRLCGVMATVVQGGDVRAGMPIVVEPPMAPHLLLQCV